MSRSSAFTDLPPCGMLPSGCAEVLPESTEVGPLDYRFFCTRDTQWLGKYIQIKRLPHQEFLYEYFLGKKKYNPTVGSTRTHEYVSFCLFESFHLVRLLREIVPQIEECTVMKPKPLIKYFENRPTLNPWDVFTGTNSKSFWENCDVTLDKLRVKLVLDKTYNAWRLYLNNIPNSRSAESWTGATTFIPEHKLRSLLEYLEYRNKDQNLVPHKSLYQFWDESENFGKRMLNDGI